MAAKRTKGFWVIVIMGKLLLLVLIIGQMMAFIDYDFTVSIGLQESKDIIGVFTENLESIIVHQLYRGQML